MFQHCVLKLGTEGEQDRNYVPYRVLGREKIEYEWVIDIQFGSVHHKNVNKGFRRHTIRNQLNLGELETP